MMDKNSERSKYDGKNIENLIGMKFGKWTVLRDADSNDAGQKKYLCRCDCGTVREVVAYALRKGDSTSCGCIRKFENAKIQVEHITEEEVKQIERDLIDEFIALRNEHGLTQTDFSQIVGVPQGQVSRFESQKYNAQLNTMLKYLASMGYTLVIAKQRKK